MTRFRRSSSSALTGTCTRCGQEVERVSQGDLNRHLRPGIGRAVTCFGKASKPTPDERRRKNRGGATPRDKNGQTLHMREKDRVMGNTRNWPEGTLKR